MSRPRHPSRPSHPERWLAGVVAAVAVYAAFLVIAGPLIAQGFDLLGFGAAEAAWAYPSLIDADYTSRELASAGIGISFSLGLDFDTDISSGDPEKGRLGKAKLLDAISVCRDCGGNYIGGILYSAFGKYYTQPTAAGVAQSVDILREVAEVAAASDITLCLEVVNRYETNILNTAAQYVGY